MKTTSAMLVASARSLASMFALADDRIPSDVPPAEQAKMKKEADGKKEADWIEEAFVKMWSRTPPSESAKKRIAASKASGAPEADKILREQKGS